MAELLASSTLIKNAELVVAMAPDGQVLEGASVGVVGNRITEVGSGLDQSRYEKVIDARGKLVLPGLVNTHHHLFQAFLKGYPDIQNKPIEEWVNRVSQVVRSMSEEMIYDGALLNLAELALYGCTTTADMPYIMPPGRDLLAPAIAAARSIGIRFQPYSGGISLGRKDGALFPDDMTQDSDTIAAQVETAINLHHDPAELAMVRIGFGLCGIYTNTPDDFKNGLSISQKYGVNLQTHVGESDWETSVYSPKKFRSRPVDYLRADGWAGPMTSYVHAINLNSTEIIGLARNGTNVSHCPISNARSSSGEAGIAPITEMLAAGVNIGIGVDGSAGNDSSNLLEELRWARTIQGARVYATYLDPMATLKMGTINGAKLLGRGGEIGSIEPGKAADLALFDQNTIEASGNWDPVTALLSTQARRAAAVMVNGHQIIDNYELIGLGGISEAEIVSRAAKHIRRLKDFSY